MPHAGWFIAILPAMGLLTALAVSPSVRAVWEAHVTTIFSPLLLQVICASAWLAHVGEALYARALATRIGRGAVAAWMIQTFFVGFPSLRLLVARARRVAS